MLLKQPAIGQAGESVVIGLILDLLLGLFPLGDVANEADDAGHAAGRIVVRTVDGRDPTPPGAAGDVVVSVGSRHRLAAEPTRDQLIDLLLPKWPKDVSRPPPPDGVP